MPCASWLMNLDFAGSLGAGAPAAGPYEVTALDSYAPGSVAMQGYKPGLVEADVYVPGAAVGSGEPA